MNPSTHRPNCLCGAGYHQFHCVHCGAEAIPVRDRRRGWVMAAVIATGAMIGRIWVRAFL